MDKIFSKHPPQKSKQFELEKHKEYCISNLLNLKFPADFCPIRVTLIHFLTSTLDILNSLDSLPFTKSQIITWIYTQQIMNTPKEAGFRGGPYMGFGSPLDPEGEYKSEEQPSPNEHDLGNIANTYSALCVLLTCGDSLSRVDKVGIRSWVKGLQNGDGSFRAITPESESDVRFLYCACAISVIIGEGGTQGHPLGPLDPLGPLGPLPDTLDPLHNPLFPFDIGLALQYIQGCESHLGGYSWVRYGEPHSGLSYCALASLKLMGLLTPQYCDIEKNIEYLVNRNQKGWNGRVGKLQDTCYTFWNLGSLLMLGMDTDIVENTKYTAPFLIQCQCSTGGFSKHSFMSEHPDPLHTFYSLAGLSLIREEGIELNELDPLYGITLRASNAFGLHH